MRAVGLDDRLSPEQIVARSRREHPDDPEYRVSHETIYQFVHRHAFATRAEARIRIATWITDFYNTRRRHSKASGLPPAEFERVMWEARKAHQARYRRQEAASAA